MTEEAILLETCLIIVVVVVVISVAAVHSGPRSLAQSCRFVSSHANLG
jgi:hypothetical protein